MNVSPKMALFTVVGTLAYLGLAVFGRGGFAAYFSHLPLTVVVVATLVMSGVGMLSSGNLIPAASDPDSLRIPKRRKV